MFFFFVFVFFFSLHFYSQPTSRLTSISENGVNIRIPLFLHLKGILNIIPEVFPSTREMKNEFAALYRQSEIKPRNITKPYLSMASMVFQHWQWTCHRCCLTWLRQKAFDTIDYNILFEKLRSVGTDDISMLCFTSYLLDIIFTGK